MLENSFNTLSLSLYELYLCAKESTLLPSFLGSTLRGAFGQALKDVVCIMNHRDCAKCIVFDRCTYPYIFETPVPKDLHQLKGFQQAPHPFILMPPIDRKGLSKNFDKVSIQAEQILPFRLTLIGKAQESLPYIIYALSQMAERGLGYARAKFQLVEVKHNNKTIYTIEQQRLSNMTQAAHSLKELVTDRLKKLSTKDTIKLKFLTPSRIRVDGDLQTELTFQLLVRNLLRRLSMLFAVHAEKPLELNFKQLIELASGAVVAESNLKWLDLERYSNRQKTKMKIGGFVGEIAFSGEAIETFLPLIIAGEILGIGTGTTFGLGHYQIEPAF
ncbi:MAG: CRISPR system precrRNA processing endoribonuclease RAMP protein Cas6 [Blastocatellia bacterium]|nr:CRISPR system precrRNA processing endoribonuclease RAMP protein Cas6 [Blastocatellia bacterium]